MSADPAETTSSPRLPPSVEIFDTTLRDGSQLEGLSLTVDDKLRIAEQLDHLGVHYIEGGWPGANPKDDEFFRRVPTDLSLKTATMVAFGSTRRPLGKVDSDDTLRNLVEAGTSAVCIVGKAWDYHVTQALQTTLDEGVAMVADSVSFLARSGLRVLFDAEHFFDGYRRNPEFSLRVLEAAASNGVSTLVLCDTNGGTLPADVERIVGEVVDLFSDIAVGVHFHDDAGCAVANAIAAVRQGARQVQGCINGYGERTGNANLTTIIPNLSLKMGVTTIPADRIERLTPVAHHIAELVNVTPNPQQPYVGSSAFAHKAGLHTSAIARAPDAYEHIVPDSVGNGTRFVVSELAGRSTLQIKAAELGLELDGRALGEVLTQLKELEHRGYHFEAADGSLELLMRSATGWKQSFFRLESFRIITEQREDGAFVTEATIKVHVGDERVVATAEGNGPVNALDGALRKAIGRHYPGLAHLHLTDYKVRVLDTAKGTAAVTRVLIDSTDGETSWSTIGVSENIIEASWEALSDSVVYGLLHQERTVGVTQPDYVPIIAAERVRQEERLPPAGAWLADRPGEIRGRSPHGARLGNNGPDLGYGLKLARQLVGRLQLDAGEHSEDAVAGCFAVGAARASLFGRAPVVYDMELAYGVWGYLGGAPEDLVAFRVPFFRGAAHHYWDQREIVDRVPEATLRLSPAEVLARVGQWRTLLTTD